MVLGEVVNGQLQATSLISYDRLLSGNYFVVVHNNKKESRAVVSGKLYVN